VELGRTDGRNLGPDQYVAYLSQGTASFTALVSLSSSSTRAQPFSRSFQPKGQVPDYEEPVILRAENPTIEEFCNRLHKGLLAEFSHAWVCKCRTSGGRSFPRENVTLTFLVVSCFVVSSLTLGGRSAKHQPQRCGKDHVLCDEDVVQLCKKI
jgi:hypothetical protein